jgi:hypothetical protein
VVGNAAPDLLRKAIVRDRVARTCGAAGTVAVVVELNVTAIDDGNPKLSRRGANLLRLHGGYGVPPAHIPAWNVPANSMGPVWMSPS